MVIQYGHRHRLFGFADRKGDRCGGDRREVLIALDVNSVSQDSRGPVVPFGDVMGAADTLGRLPLKGDRLGLGGGQGDDEVGLPIPGVRSLVHRGGVGNRDLNRVVVADSSFAGAVGKADLWGVEQFDTEVFVELVAVVRPGKNCDFFGQIPWSEGNRLTLHVPIVMIGDGGGPVFGVPPHGDFFFGDSRQSDSESQKAALRRCGIGDGHLRPGVIVSDDPQRPGFIKHH